MSKRTERGFDFLASRYTSLTRLVFGKTLDHAQKFPLDFIEPGVSILILGGGSGQLLSTLLQKHPAVSVDYIDLSPKMIELAKGKTGNPSSVNFITGTEQNIPSHAYTVVITNFYLDLFSDKKLNEVIDIIKPRLADNVIWLATDFISEKTWHRIFLKVMYVFFKIVTRIEAGSLPDWQSALSHAGFREVKSKNFYGGFIKSSVYKRVI